MSQRISSPFGTVIIDDSHPGGLFHSESDDEKVTHRHQPVSMTPPVDVYEEDDKFSVWMDLPGVDKDSIQVSVTGNTLSVNAHTKKLNLSGGHWARHERRTGPFVRSLQLGQAVNADGISASYSDGTLVITIDKTTKAKSKSIPVNLE